jgi:hypothetical protein
MTTPGSSAAKFVTFSTSTVAAILMPHSQTNTPIRGSFVFTLPSFLEHQGVKPRFSSVSGIHPQTHVDLQPNQPVPSTALGLFSAQEFLREMGHCILGDPDAVVSDDDASPSHRFAPAVDVLPEQSPE